MRPLLQGLAILLLIGFPLESAHALDPPVLVKERAGAESASPIGCPLAPNRNGNCANYHWYNVCSGYIWLYKLTTRGEAVGTQFGGPEQPCVAPGNRIKRAITYWRNVYGYSWYCYDPSSRVYLDRDDNGDGCPDGVLAATPPFWPSMRWNCQEFNATIPDGVHYVIVRQEQQCVPPGPGIDQIATDGPYSESCDPLGTPRSFYYGVNMSQCIPWRGPTGRADNFLTWLIVDTGVTATQETSWGSIKGLFR